MTDPLKSYIEEYVLLESGMQKLVLGKCASLCAQCTAVCCDVVMCVEAVNSPFLKLIHQQADQFNKENGFLSPTGCSLKKGRPSVCYEYFCDNHFYYQPSDRHAEILKILGSLLFHATRNAKDNVPLDEIPEEDLNRLNFHLLLKQLKESSDALEIIQNFFKTGSVTEKEYMFLKTIRLPEEFDTTAESSARQ